MDNSIRDQTDNVKNNPIVFLDIAVETEKGNTFISYGY